MTNELVTVPHAGSEALPGVDTLPAHLQALVTAMVPDAVENARAANTKKAYKADWARFTGWCRDNSVPALPATPAVVVAYLTAAALTTDAHGNPAYKVGTLTRWRNTINLVHAEAGHPRPASGKVISDLLRGLGKGTDATRVRRVSPITLDVLHDLLDSIDTTTTTTPTTVAVVTALRDKALLLTGFAGAFRRTELSGLNISDVTFHRADGIHLRIQQSKTDQDGAGRTVALPYGEDPQTCPVCALHRWITLLNARDKRTPKKRLDALALELAADRTHCCRTPAPPTRNCDGPLFRPVAKSGLIREGHHLTGNSIATIVKKRAAAAGLDPALYAGHSLRAGFVTEAFRAGHTGKAIRRQTGHKDDALLDVYQREEAPLSGNAVTNLGL